MVTAAPLAWMSILVVVLTVTGAFAVDQRELTTDLPLPDPVEWFVPVQIVSALVWIGAGLLLTQRRDLWWWKLAFLAAASHAVAALCVGYAVQGLVVGADVPGAEVAAALPSMLLPVEVPVMVYMVVSLPSGALTRRGTDRWGWVAVVMASVGVVLGAVSAPDTDGTDFEAARNPISVGVDLGPVVTVLIAGGAVLGVVVLVANWRRSTGSDRLALRWVVWLQVGSTLVVVPVIALAPIGVGVGVAQVASAVGLLAMVTVIRRQTMLGVERLLERTLQFVLLAAGLAAVYTAVVALLSGLVDDAARPIAAALVALAVLPVRDRVGRGVARFVYGDRADSSEIVERIADAAQSDHDPRGLVESVLDELRRGTGAPAAWIELDRQHAVLSSGVVPPRDSGTFAIELRHRGARIGQLSLAPAHGDNEVDPLAERVVRSVAPHVAVLASAYLEHDELVRARTDLIRAREEERRRLRHDLHDGLGPILTGAAFSADAAANLVERDPGSARSMIEATRLEVGTAIGEVRRIVENLRPPAIDELGLAGAIRQVANRFPELDISVDECGKEVALPAAIEVAAYRITTEALTNVARHANATEAIVEIRANGDLTVSVTDNGTGISVWRPGVGITSMTQRAVEAGGVLSAGPDSSGGGRVVATFPIEAP